MSGGSRTIIVDLDSVEEIGVKSILQKPFTHEQLQKVFSMALS